VRDELSPPAYRAKPQTDSLVLRVTLMCAPGHILRVRVAVQKVLLSYGKEDDSTGLRTRHVKTALNHTAHAVHSVGEANEASPREKPEIATGGLPSPPVALYGDVRRVLPLSEG
jgi:hypothetical protein